MPLSARVVLAGKSGWQADRQMDRQAPMHTDRDTDTKKGRQDDWRKNR